MMMSWRGALVGLIAFSVSCAYQLGYPRRILLGGYDQIAIPVFKNSTKETGTEVYFTNSLIRYFERSKVAQVIRKQNSPVTLEGELVSVTYRPLVRVTGGGEELRNLPSSAVLTTSYTVNVIVNLSLKRNSDQKTIWSSSFSGESVYSSPRVESAGVNSANALYNHSVRYREFEKLAASMMLEAHDRLTEKF